VETPVARLFTDSVRKAAAQSFAADPAALESLGDFESYVFGYETDGHRRVLRISHPSHRSAEQMQAELHWVDYLASRGLRFARPVRSPAGSFVHTVEDGAAVFHVCAFERVPGRVPGASDWTPELFRNWGQFLGRAHALTRDYEPPVGSPHRYSWSDDPYIAHGKNWIPESEVTYREQWDKVWGEIAQLPRSRNSYGICHTDLHQYNFHVLEGEIHAFDTDDCCHCWFVEDISSVFYYGSKHPAAGEDPQKFVDWAWPSFWSAYKKEHDLGVEWLERIHLFQRARVLTLYALTHMKFEEGSEERETHLPVYRKRLDSARPVLDVRFDDVK